MKKEDNWLRFQSSLQDQLFPVGIQTRDIALYSCLGIIVCPCLSQKWASTGLFFIYFWSLSNRKYNFYNKSMFKMSIRNKAPGFEPTTFRTRVVTYNHKTGAPGLCLSLCYKNSFKVPLKM